MIEQTPGITRPLDRLESNNLMRCERPFDDRRQLLYYVTKAGLNLLSELDTPLKNLENKELRTQKPLPTKVADQMGMLKNLNHALRHHNLERVTAQELRSRLRRIPTRMLT